MADDPTTSNSLADGRKRQVGRVGDVPEAVRQRYYRDDQGGPGAGYYVDAQVNVAAFRDRGRVLVAARADPNAIRDMTLIARHRGWTVVSVRGAKAFRRQAWLAGRAAGLDVHGYRPSERDRQELERRVSRHARRGDGTSLTPEADPAAKARLAVVDRLVRARIADVTAQNRLIASARLRIARWLEQGARFEPLRAPARQADGEVKLGRERRR